MLIIAHCSELPLPAGVYRWGGLPDYAACFFFIGNDTDSYILIILHQ